MALVIIKKGDRLPPLDATCEDAEGKPIDLSSGPPDVKFYMRRSGEAANLINGAAMTIVDAPNGKVRYAWQAGDSITPGRYIGEIKVDFGAGGLMTFPNDGYLDITISEGLA